MLRLTNLLDEEMKHQGTSKKRQAEKINYKEICVSSKGFGFYAVQNGELLKHFRQEISKVRDTF